MHNRASHFLVLGFSNPELHGRKKKTAVNRSSAAVRGGGEQRGQRFRPSLGAESASVNRPGGTSRAKQSPTLRATTSAAARQAMKQRLHARELSQIHVKLCTVR